ncbi:MAG TPA: tetratricopeptide repeat protein [Polyangia bacterium]|nr:tetratricopeptide repeat protein [Polyangia bacterium]
MVNELRQYGLQCLDDGAGPARSISDQRARQLVRGALSRVIAGEGEARPRPIAPARRFGRVSLVAGALLAGGAALAGLAYRGLGLGSRTVTPAPVAAPTHATLVTATEREVDTTTPTTPNVATATATSAPVASVDRPAAAHPPAIHRMTPSRSHALLRSSGEAAAPASAKSADDLLSRANQLRAQRRWHEAAAAYQAVVAGSSETHAAYVAMLARAELLLDHLGRPAEALGLFERALAEPSGVLTEEARYGLAACYRALGDVENERRALNAFLAAHPHSLMRASAAARLGELH